MRTAGGPRTRGGVVWGGAWMAAVLCLAVACSDAPQEGPSEPSPAAGANLIIISLDTFRSDTLSLEEGGGPRKITPNLARFAEQSVTFTHARATAPQTAPSHMSLFTSMLPSVHGVQNVQHAGGGPLIESVPDSIPTLAEVLTAGGYRSVGLTDGGNLNRAHGFPRGFEHYTVDLSGAEAQVADGLKWLDELAAADSPYFLFWHTYEVHAPYVSPQEYMDRWEPKGYDGIMSGRLAQLMGLTFQQRFSAMRSIFWVDKEQFGWPESAYLHSLYKAGVQFTDAQLGELLDGMEQRGVFDDTIVVILSDHGEEFFEHGQWQHDQVFEECLRVPLMVRMPGGVGAGTRIDTPVGILDVMPTLLELMDIEPEQLPLESMPRMQGLSLAGSVLQGTEPSPRPIISEYRADRKGSPLYDWQVAIYNEGMKYIVDEHRSRDGEKQYLYKLSADPDEQSNLAETSPDVVARFRKLREHFHQDLEAYANLERMSSGESLDCDALRQLVELGYVGAEALKDCD